MARLSPVAPGSAADRIVFLGHATVLIEAGRRAPAHRSACCATGSRICAVRFRRSIRRMWAGIDAVLISHLHHDHLDLASLRLLGLDTRLLVPAGAGAWLRRRGFTNVTELSVGETASVGALTVTAVEAVTTAVGRGRAACAPRRWATSSMGGQHGLLRRRHRAVRRHVRHCRSHRSTSRCCRSPAGGRRSARVTWIHSTPRARPACCGRASRFRSTGERCRRSASPGATGSGSVTRRDMFAEHVASLAPSVEVRILEPGQETML